MISARYVVQDFVTLHVPRAGDAWRRSSAEWMDQSTTTIHSKVSTTVTSNNLISVYSTASREVFEG